MNDQSITEASKNTHERGISMPSAGSTPTISAIKSIQTYILEHTATMISHSRH